MFSLELLIFFLSSLFIIGLSYYKVPNTILQEITSVLLVVLLILFTRGRIFGSKTPQGVLFKYTPLFLGAFFVQLLVISTGGFFSPFLILLHLFTLGSSFLLGLKSSLSFLIFSVLVLIAHNILNPQMFALLRDDPGSVFLYLVSFAVIIPLSQFLMHSYHFKDALSQLLKEYIQIGEKREESILTSLSELIIVTDQSLNIISTNEAVEEALSLSPSEIIYHSLLKVLPLKDEGGKQVTMESFSIDSMLRDKASRITKSFSFQTKADSQPRPVIIQTRPVTNPKGEISQIVFVITDTRATPDKARHANLEQVRSQQKKLTENLKRTLTKAKLWQSAVEVELLGKTEEDLFIALEIEDHPIKESIDFLDIACVGKDGVTARQELAKMLGVSLQFILPPEEKQEEAFISLSETDVPSQALPISEFTVSADGHWLEVAILRLLDIAILLAAEKKNSLVQLTVRREDESSLSISITTPSPSLTKTQQQELFQEYYGNLGKITNLHLGSGLEGFIAKSILLAINIPLEVKFESNPPCLEFLLKFSKLLSSTMPPVEKLVLNMNN